MRPRYGSLRDFVTSKAYEQSPGLFKKKKRKEKSNLQNKNTNLLSLVLSLVSLAHRAIPAEVLLPALQTAAAGVNQLGRHSSLG